MLSGILGISLEREKKSKRWMKEAVGRDQIDLMLTVESFNDYKSCINLHWPNSSLTTSNRENREQERNHFIYSFASSLSR